MIITANARLARVLRQVYDAEQIDNGLAVWAAPEILPVSAWLQERWRSWLYTAKAANPLQLLSASQERVIWENIVAQSDSANALLQVAPTAEAAGEAWNLMHAWKVPFEGPEWNNSRDAEAFHGWAEEFQRFCEKRRMLSAAKLPAFVAAKVLSGEIAVPPHVELAGFVEFTPAQIHLFDAMRQMAVNVEVRSAPNREGKASAMHIGFSDARHEIRASARWARMLLESHGATETAVPSTGPSIGIVVPELSKYRSAIERVFGEELHPGGRLAPNLDATRAFNISLGPAFSDYPLIQSALLILRMDPTAVISFDDVSRLLRCPYLANSQGEASAMGCLDVQLRRLREPEILLSEMSAAAPPGLKSGLIAWQRQFEKLPPRQAPSGWASAFSNILASLGWPGERSLNSAEYQTIARWNDLLSEFSALDAVSGLLQRGAAISMLQRLAAGHQFQPESETAPIQILGVLEASGMVFDHLWIIGMHDGIWPRAAAPNPFLPLRLQRAANLPQSSPQRELEFTRILSLYLLGSATHVIVSYPQLESDSAQRPSPLFSGLKDCSPDVLQLPVTPGHAELLFASSEIERIEDHQAPRWTGAKARGGTSIFTQQAACPFQAFVRVRLGAELLETAETGLTALDRGNLVHDVLHRVWSELGSQETLKDTPALSLRAIIHDEVQAVLSKAARTKRALQKPRFNMIEQARLERVAGEWLELEKQRQPFLVLPTESKRQANVGGIDLTFRPDRVDRLDDGSHVVVDYKTSRHGPAEWDSSRPDEPQLPLYAITAGVPLSGVLFGVAKLGEMKFTGLVTAEGIVPGIKPDSGEAALPARLSAWRPVLEQLAADFQSGKAGIDPKDAQKTCRICGLQSLCRISESNLPVEDLESEPQGD